LHHRKAIGYGTFTSTTFKDPLLNRHCGQQLSVRHARMGH